MHYTKFRIQNFKGIQDTTVKLAGQSMAGVFAFVGLNESGKTTILEAIHSFSPDFDTSEVAGRDEKSGVAFPDRVPRHLISNFTGDVSVSATMRLTEDEQTEFCKSLKTNHNLIVDPSSIGDELSLERQQRFKDGDFQKSFFSLRSSIQVKSGRQKKWRAPDTEEKTILRDEVYSRTPDIAYFPTFVFDFPERIFLTQERGDRVSDFYRQVFQDILDYDGKGHTIAESIVRRVRSEEKRVGWLAFLDLWNKGSDKAKIQHVMDRASAVVTSVVFGRWNEIFGEDASGKEINVSFETLQGEKRDLITGVMTKTNDHDLYVKFQIKDGTRRFDVNDRSLGFRWFFAFMLFTQFRVARASSRPILFLFDEPASNLHAAAQQKLIESFPEIACEGNTLAYSTHSHYMIEPKWLEQTFIVTNRADTPSGSVIGAISLSDESLDIKATRYGKFVGDHPTQTTYFQPVLDRLQVIPTRFDIDRVSIIVEGKSDYYVLRYAARLMDREDLPLVPALGAGTFAPLIALHLGWGLDLIVLLDGDRKGKQERDRYVREYGIQRSRTLTLDELGSDLAVIEDLLDVEAKSAISQELGLDSDPKKKEILRFFQEALARDEIPSLGKGFESSAGLVLDGLKQHLDRLG